VVEECLSRIKVLDVNQASLELYGASSKEELIGNLEAIVPLQLDDAFVERIADLAEGGTRFASEIINKTLSGETIDLAFSSYISPEFEESWSRVVVSYVDVTARKQVEEELKEGEELLRRVLDTNLNLIFVKNRDGRYVLTNRAMAELYGTTVDEIVGKTDLDFSVGEGISAKEAAQFLADDREVMDSQAAKVIPEAPLTQADGTVRWFRTTKVPLTLAGRADFVLSVAVEITERKRAEEEAEERRLYLETVLASAPDAIVTLDCQNRVTEWNRGAETLFGYASEQALGRDIDALVAGGDAGVSEQAAGFSRQTLAGETVPSTEVVRHRQDGTAVNVLVAGSPIRRGDELIGTVAVYTDITERKRAEEAIRQSEERYRGLFEGSPVALWEQDFSAVKAYLDGLRADGVSDFREYLRAHPEAVEECGARIRVLDVNQASLELYGASSKEELMVNLDAIIALPQSDVFRERIAVLAEGGTGFASEVINKTLLGEILHLTFSSYISPEFEDSWERVIVAFTDIRESKRAHEEIESLSRFPSENANPVLRVAEDGLVLYANEASRGLLSSWGCEEGQRLPDEWREVASDVSSSGLSGEAEVEVEDRTISLTFAPVVEAGYVNVYGLDVTERRRAEEALGASERLLAAIIEADPNGIFVKDDEGRYVLLNGTVADAYGSTPERMLGKTDPEFAELQGLDMEEAEKYLTDDLEVIRSKQTKVIPAEPFTRADGTVQWFQTTKAPLDLEGRGGGMLGVAVDITERKVAEEALRQSEERFRTVFEDAPDAYYINDLKGAFVDGNRAAEALMGYSRDELVGGSLLKLGLLPLNQIPKAAAALAANVLGRSTGPDEFVLNRKDGRQVQVEIQTRPTKIGGRLLVLGLARDITKRKAAEEEAERRQELLVALGRASEAVMRARTADEVYRTLGEQINGLGYHVIVLTLTEDQKHLVVSHVTMRSKPGRVSRHDEVEGAGASGETGGHLDTWL